MEWDEESNSGGSVAGNLADGELSPVDRAALLYPYGKWGQADQEFRMSVALGAWTRCT